jgi:deoxyadenosine/deoxycytidine kinase
MLERKEILFKHIAIEGILRAGKTQLANILAKRIGGRIVLDRTENPYIKDFYEEKEGAAFLTQLVFLVNRYHQQVGLRQRGLFDERIICDYLFEKDKIYAYQTLSDDELVVYEKIYNVFVDISEKYLEDICEAYDYFFFNYQTSPLLVVKADDLDLSRDEDVEDLIEKIEQMKKDTLYYVPLSKSSKE